jgi:hypothetical protein
VYFISCEWATVQGQVGVYLYLPPQKAMLGNLSPDKSGVRWTSLESGENFLEAGQGPDKFGGGLWGPVGVSRIRSQIGQVRSHHQTSPVGLSGVRWKSLWNPDSSDKSGETWKMKIWSDKHHDLSQTFSIRPS